VDLPVPGLMSGKSYVYHTCLLRRLAQARSVSPCNIYLLVGHL